VQEVPEGHPEALYGKTFVLSGVLDSLFRETAADLIKKHSGRVTQVCGFACRHANAGAQLLTAHCALPIYDCAGGSEGGWRRELEEASRVVQRKHTFNAEVLGLALFGLFVASCQGHY